MNATTVSHNRSQNGRPSSHFVGAQIAARDMSTDALMAWVEVLAIDMEDRDPDWPGPVGRFIAGERHHAAMAELDRRVRIFSMPDSKASAYARDREHWAALARTVRESVSVPEVLALVGCHIRMTGTNRPQGGTEFHSDCPVCRDGVDRLVSWDGPNGRAWCRKCRWSADVIAIAQGLMPGCEHFRDAVKTLAKLAIAGERSA